ncbi:hypothetical protein SCCGRSA3_02053 [Marine Group I thaumarchaeote SCGC RSA3]|uniref:Uncharacterized protein n=3 Tax=Marine Group I TaxID=905826 RepID=A0A081RNY3_9ARCH|nr:hypothetical protein AAA799N04_00576 [Marine Group I thaumarchaeote SCGC AAA799-N04]KFM15671.1 hypothetical protein AAA799D11_01113 [Marine Group I thaumarchaeote SCGC AAA799-D11]KFM16804.1 hypothetical protein SCCGRSA3_02053 [Marine Group I thaumarchaeote SCGC RSA3]
MLESYLLAISNIFLQLDYLNPFDDPSDIVTQDDIIAGSVTVAIAGLSIFLTIMAVSAFRKTGVSQLKYIALAFSLFTIYLATEAIQELLPLDDDSFDLFLSVIMMFILISFFFGIMRKKKNNT